MRRGGSRACSTRSIHFRSPTRTATASVICRGSSITSTTSQWLGVDAIWLSPITVSPNADWGYDVADYCAVQPEMGTLAAFDALVAAAHERDIRVVLDFVPNHTSEQHEWFVDARSSQTRAASRLVPLGRRGAPTDRRRTTG